MWMARASMEGSGGDSDACCKRMKLIEAVPCKVEPASPILRHFCIVDVNQLLSLLGKM